MQKHRRKYVEDNVKALSQGAISLATCNAILLLADAKFANIYFYHSLLIFFNISTSNIRH